MVDGVCWQPVTDELPPAPLGGQIRLSAADLADCPSFEDDVQRVLAGVAAERSVDRWWADPAAQAEWDADLAALYAQVAADDRRAAVERRVVLDGDPGLASLAAALEVLAGAPAWTPAQADTAGFVDELRDGVVSAFGALHRVQGHLLWQQVRCAEAVVRA